MPDGRSLKCFVPGGSSMPVLMPDQLDVGLAFEAVAAAGSMSGSGGVIVIDDSHLHGAVRPAHRRVLPPRVVRQVHAVPRGDALDRRPADAHRDRRRHERGDRPPARRLRPHRGQVPVPARRRVRDAGALAHPALPRGVRGARARRPLPVRRDVRALDPGAEAQDPAAAGEPSDGSDRGRRRPSPWRWTAAASPCRRARRWSSPPREAGIEVPVFCYEPRLGAPIGACRMCLVEIEGMPKLQAGCTMTATRRHGRAHRATPPSGRRTGRTRCSSSCCSTTRWTARSATRAASARCRT